MRGSAPPNAGTAQLFKRGSDYSLAIAGGAPTEKPRQVVVNLTGLRFRCALEGGSRKGETTCASGEVVGASFRANNCAAVKRVEAGRGQSNTRNRTSCSRLPGAPDAGPANQGDLGAVAHL